MKKSHQSEENVQRSALHATELHKQLISGLLLLSIRFPYALLSPVFDVVSEDQHLSASRQSVLQTMGQAFVVYNSTNMRRHQRLRGHHLTSYDLSCEVGAST